MCRVPSLLVCFSYKLPSVTGFQTFFSKVDDSNVFLQEGTIEDGMDKRTLDRMIEIKFIIV